MKIIVFENNYTGGEAKKTLGWSILADSALSNAGKPFYLPENSGKVKAYVSAAIRISRLGKSIAPKFAGRYYAEFAPAINFRLTDLAEALKEQGLPTDPAYNFDKALFADRFLPIEELKEIELTKNGEPVARWEAGSLREGIDEVISQFSVTNTVKMGDLILPGLSGGIEIAEGDSLLARAGKNAEFLVRVK